MVQSSGGVSRSKDGKKSDERSREKELEASRSSVREYVMVVAEMKVVRNCDVGDLE
jgi:hypothetical protein